MSTSTNMNMSKRAIRAAILALFSVAIASSAIAAEGMQPLTAKDRYIAGGIVGTVLGLGVGHAIQNRYEEKGWLFTGAEGTGIALIIVGSVIPMPNAASIPLIVVGALGLAGFKAWEIIDVWTGPMNMGGKQSFLPDQMFWGRNGRRSVGTESLLSEMSQAGLIFRF